MEPSDIISYLLPHLVVAGSYSDRIQGGVGTHGAKDGATIFHHALSDADITIQSFMEVALLAKFPELSFYSEEQAVSLNQKYFSGRSELEVLLDPIDGTRWYIDNKDRYQIIVTIHDAREIVGAVMYMPRRGLCYYASKGGGAWRLTRDQMVAGSTGVRLNVSKSVGPVLTFNSPELMLRLTGQLPVIDLLHSYIHDGARHCSTDILEGTATGVAHASCQAIDGGAIGFIVSEAGGVMTDFQGRRPKSFRDAENRTIPDIIVATNEDVHRRLIKALG
jgi:myo-inositol-1(or 4)-monophosphatase